MLSLGPIAFAAPWLLLGLLALPALWWLLRVTPPAPKRQDFPAIALLRDLPAPEETPARTPWWLLLLRLVAAALVIIGLARPVWGPSEAGGGTGPLLIALDDGWAAAADWPDRVAAAEAALDAAAREGRRTALMLTAPPALPEQPRITALMPAEELRGRLAATRPKPWAPDREGALAALQQWRAAHPGAFATLYVADGIEHGRGTDAFPPLAEALAAGGALTVARAEGRPTRLLPPPRAEAERLVISVRTTPLAVATEAVVLARTGDGRTLDRAVVPIPAGATEAEAALPLPLEIRNQVVRLDHRRGGGGECHRAAGRALPPPTGRPDRRRRGERGRCPADRRAVLPRPRARALRRAAARAGGPAPATPHLGAGARRPPVTDARRADALARWVEAGGTLVRFAGARVAKRRTGCCPCRCGRRTPDRRRAVMGASAVARPFPEGSPFQGLVPPPESRWSGRCWPSPRRG
jgi:hypothetical protein